MNLKQLMATMTKHCEQGFALPKFARIHPYELKSLRREYFEMHVNEAGADLDLDQPFDFGGLRICPDRSVGLFTVEFVNVVSFKEIPEE